VFPILNRWSLAERGKLIEGISGSAVRVTLFALDQKFCAFLLSQQHDQVLFLNRDRIISSMLWRVRHVSHAWKWGEYCVKYAAQVIRGMYNGKGEMPWIWRILPLSELPCAQMLPQWNVGSYECTKRVVGFAASFWGRKERFFSRQRGIKSREE